MMRFWTNVSRWRNEILLRGVEDGRRFKRAVPYKPTLYVPAKAASDMRALDGTPVEPLTFNTMAEARDFAQEYGGGNGLTIYGQDKWVYNFIAEEYPGDVLYDNQLVKVAYIDIETEVGQGFPDPSKAEQTITAITVAVGGHVLSWAIPPDGEQTFTPNREMEYYECRDEKELLSRFLDRWHKEDVCPDILSGWNIEGFDVPYLVNRIKKVLSETDVKKLSPWRKLQKQKLFVRGKELEIEVPMGMAVLDYIPMYKKLAVATRAVDTPDNYKLDTIAEHEGVGRKISYDEYDGLMGLYKNNFQLFMEYNIRDVLLVQAIEDKRGLIELVIMKAYSDKINYEDALGSVRPWEQIIHCDLMEQGIVMPPRREVEKQGLVGAFVKDPPPGMYRWVVSEDLDSLYSHLMMQFNISPETRVGQIDELVFRPTGHPGTTEAGNPDGIIRGEAIEHIEFIMSGVVDKYRDYLRENDLVVAANGCTYRRDKGFLPKILEKMYAKRRLAKAAMLEAQANYERTKDPRYKQEAGRWKNSDKVQKTNLNACYGVTTNQYYIFYDHGNAEAITMSGQLAIKWIERKLNGVLNEVLETEGADYVIAIDTDSVYLDLSRVVDTHLQGKSRDEVCTYLDKLCKTKLGQFINDSYQELADYMNAAEQKMSMKRESIADRAIWTGKKHYILNILDKEGVRFKEPKIELKGIAAVKSDTPPAAREALKKAIDLIMSGSEDDVLDHIEATRAEFMRLPFDDIAFSKGISHMEKYYDPIRLFKPKCPIQVRAAIVYNEMLKRHKLGDYPPIFDGDKIKFAYLKMPNYARSEVIATPGPLPSAFRIEESIDRLAQFEKGFMTPLRSILDAIKWRSSRTATVEEFF